MPLIILGNLAEILSKTGFINVLLSDVRDISEEFVIPSDEDFDQVLEGKPVFVSNNLEIGDTLLKIIPNLTGSNSDIDSAIIIASKSSKKSVLNVNDCIYNDIKVRFL